MTHPCKSSAIALAVCGLVLSLPAATQAAPKQALSLGDSLAVGVQPVDGAPRPTSDGHADVLAEERGVRLVQLGCAGATSTSFIKGGKGCGHATPYGKGSQLKAAERHLRANRGKVAYVTIDIGANDVASCAAGGELDAPCLTKGIAAMRKNLPVIAKRLRAAGGPKLRMAAMTLYNPFLAFWLRDDELSRTLAQASVSIAKDQVNATIRQAFRKHGFRIADVGTAFGTYRPFTQTTPDGLPVAVAEVCRLTWMCLPEQDIHANAVGYQKIAEAFRRVL